MCSGICVPLPVHMFLRAIKPGLHLVGSGHFLAFSRPLRWAGFTFPGGEHERAVGVFAIYPSSSIPMQGQSPPP